MVDEKVKELTIIPQEPLGYTLDGEMYKTQSIIENMNNKLNNCI